MQKKTIFALAAILLVSALLGTSLLTRGHDWGDDFAAYIMQAKSILAWDMDGFVAHNAFTITQSSSRLGPVAYPWGYPLILAPAYVLVGHGPLALKLPGVLAYLGFLLVFFLWMRTRFVSTESLLAVSLFAFNPGLLSFLNQILSDIPFLFLSTLSVLLADAYAREQNQRRGLALAALNGASIFAAFFVRTQGLTLLGGMLLFQVIRFLGHPDRRRKILRDSLALTAVFGALWGVSVLLFPGGQGSYLALYANFNVHTIQGNISSYARVFGEFFAALPGSAYILGIFAALFFAGLAARFKDDLPAVLYAVLYLLVLWSWPEWQGYRFLFPLLPIFIYFVFWGLQTLLSRLGASWCSAAHALLYTFLLLIVLAFAGNAARDAYVNLRDGRQVNGPYDPYSQQVYDFIKDKTPPESVVVFFKPRVMRLFTGYDALAATECERILLGDYLALSKKAGENLQIPPERIGECGLPLERVFQNRRFVVYKVMQ